MQFTFFLMSLVIGILIRSTIRLSSKVASGSTSFEMDDHICISISGDSLSDESKNRGPLALLLR